MLVDALIVLVIVGSIYRSWGSGFVRQILGTGGFFAGLLLGRFLEPHTITLAQTAEVRGIITAATILGMGLIGLGVGEYIGLTLKQHLVKIRLNHFDNSLGSVLTGVSVLLGVWLLATVATSLPSYELRSTIKSSHIISALNRVLPPAPNIIADIGHLIDPNGFPDVFIGNEPIPRGDINLPALGDLSAAVNAAKDSVVRIEGQGCGGIVSGTGFVVGEGLIATNAHVIAGIDQPYVQDANGTHKGRVMWFDPKLDFAVLRVSNLIGKPLTFAAERAKPGTPAAVLGYPGGGKFNAGPAAVLDEFNASGHDIYGKGHTIRDIYEIKAKVIPGNSGGPLIDKSGQVLGVIFAESTTYERIGYALTRDQVVGEIQQAAKRQNTVSTGLCAE